MLRVHADEQEGNQDADRLLKGCQTVTTMNQDTHLRQYKLRTSIVVTHWSRSPSAGPPYVFAFVTRHNVGMKKFDCCNLFQEKFHIDHPSLNSETPPISPSNGRISLGSVSISRLA